MAPEHSDTLKQRWFELLHRVQRPGQYAGGEWNAIRKPFHEIPLRVALAFPDTYAVGMSCLGFKIVYHLFNRRSDVLAERFFAPEPDMARILRSEGIPLLSLESHRPMRAFDVIAFSLQYELLLTNVLLQLDLSGLPLLARQRDARHPWVMAGGSGVLSPEVPGPFFDVLLAGDGEAIVDPLVDLLLSRRDGDADREDTIEAIAVNVPGAYVPALYTRTPSPSGFLLPRPRPGSRAPERVRAAVQEDLDGAPFPEAPPVPNVEVPHDRIALEIMRGCQAGYTRKPVRLRRKETLLRQAKALVASTGIDRISLLALSANDYPGLGDLVLEGQQAFDGQAVSLSLPSLRVDAGVADLPHLLRAVRRSGLTLAPEAGRRLRMQMNKPVQDEDLFVAASRAWAEGWNLIKLYFLVGLPGEREADIDEIPALADEVARLRGRFAPSAGRVNVTISPLVPRPHTPLQWEGQARPDRLYQAFDRIRNGRRIKSVRMKFHSVERSLLEGILSRGDAGVAKAVLHAYRGGAVMDAWDEYFTFGAWEAAFAAVGTDLEKGLFSPRPVGEMQPWEVIEAGPPRAVLRREKERARSGTPSPSCGDGHCPGLCRWKVEACHFSAVEGEKGK
ncbi:MAG: TIGR03960 family B12-binding radical SAM protein [Planctomycetota bacterium]